MVAAEMPALAAAGYRAIDDILPGTIVILGILIADAAAEIAQIDQIEIGSGDVEGGIAQVAVSLRI